MGLQDLIITPIYLIIFTFLAYLIRPYVTNEKTCKFFFPALWAKFASAIALGLVYQFYYEGGDSFNYFTHGSEWIWKAFLKNPEIGIKLLLTEGGDKVFDETYSFSSRIWYFRSPSSYFIVRLTAFFDLFTLHTYSATALFYAIFSFSGAWAFFSVIVRKYRETKTVYLAMGILFVPSILFWGSGILKDTISLGTLCWLTWSLIRWIEQKQRGWKEITVFVISFLLLYSIKAYILICYLPMVLVWLYFKYLHKIRNLVAKMLVAPVLLLCILSFGFLVIQWMSAGHSKLQFNNLAENIKITSYDIRYGWGARVKSDGGYDIGSQDGTWQKVLLLAPKAIIVSFFRPFIWEVINPFMLMASLEGFLILVIFLRAFFLKGKIAQICKSPFLIFCILFALIFAFGVGVSAYNFGTLLRYKIPMIPFLMVALLTSPTIIKNKVN